jgi:hypothetical protein
MTVLPRRGDDRVPIEVCSIPGVRHMEAPLVVARHTDGIEQMLTEPQPVVNEIVKFLRTY